MMRKKVNQEFIEAAARRDIPYLRSHITAEIQTDPLFKSGACDECMAYLSGIGLDITEPYCLDSVEAPTPTDKNQWDKRLFFGKVEFLRRNFAYEKRVSELKEIGKHAFADEIEESATFEEAPKGRRSEKKKTSPVAIIGVIAAVAAIVALIAFLLKK